MGIVRKVEKGKNGTCKYRERKTLRKHNRRQTVCDVTASDRKVTGLL